jgi:alcohol dehydrogenase
MQIADFVHRSAQSKVVFNAGAIARLGEELAQLGMRRPVLLAGRRTARSPVYERVDAALRDVERAEFAEVPEHSSVAAVEVVVARARAHRADGFVAVGGGSASDTAKAAAIWLGEGGRLEDHASRFTPPASLVIPKLEAPKLPIVAVPCTASGAEVTPSLGVRTPDGRKLLFWDLNVASRLIVIDPDANASVPAALMLATGMNGLAHCVEGLYSKTRTPVTTALALHAIGLFAQALPRVARAPDSVGARAALLAAAHLSGLVLMNARTCLHHAICHALGAVTGVGHGRANAVILPHAMAFNADFAPEAMASMGRAWPGKTAATAIERVQALQAAIGVPTRLRDIGVPREALDNVARKAMGERGIYFNPRTPRGPEEIAALLEQAW